MSTQVRLTGKHPFNVEPPLPLLMAHGHSTPASIHYVRNHGKVPVAYAGESDILKIEREWRVALPAGHGVASTAALQVVAFVAFLSTSTNNNCGASDAVGWLMHEI